MEWDYAKLSVLAKQNGGPDKLIDKIVSTSKMKGYKIGFSKGIEVGYSKGVKDTLIVVFILASVSLIAYWSYKHYLKKVIKQISNLSSSELEKTKKQLIDGINDYNNKNIE